MDHLKMRFNSGVFRFPPSTSASQPCQPRFAKPRLYSQATGWSREPSLLPGPGVLHKRHGTTGVPGWFHSAQTSRRKARLGRVEITQAEERLVWISPWPCPGKEKVPVDGLSETNPQCPKG